jgi:AcrR family transcriptional regulator
MHSHYYLQYVRDKEIKSKYISFMTPRNAPYDRDKAIQAAQQIFWRKGYHATSLKDLEHATSMKPGSIYAAFQSKENLFLEALNYYYEINFADFTKFAKNAPSPISALILILRSQGADCENPNNSQYAACMLIKTMLEVTEEERNIAARAKQHLDHIQNLFADLFEKAKQAGEIKPHVDTQSLARLFQANLTALRLELHRGTETQAVKILAETYVQQLRALK